MDISSTVNTEDWEHYSYELRTSCTLTRLGERLLMESLELADDQGTLFGFRANASLALWGLSDNERRRQVKEMELNEKDDQIMELKRTFQEHLEGSKAVYTTVLKKVNSIYRDLLPTSISDRAIKNQQLLERLQHYVSKHNKQGAAIFTKDGINYISIQDEDQCDIVSGLINLNEQVIEDPYGPKRTNAVYFTTALRQRPPEVTEDQITCEEEEVE
jgi:hypothetical protein